MAHSGSIRRTQVYLGQEELGLLEHAAAETGASRSELIRRAIRKTFGEEPQEARLEALRRSASEAGSEGDSTGRSTWMPCAVT